MQGAEGGTEFLEIVTGELHVLLPFVLLLLARRLGPKRGASGTPDILPNLPDQLVNVGNQLHAKDLEDDSPQKLQNVILGDLGLQEIRLRL